MVDLVTAYLIVDQLYIKIADGVDKKFAAKTKIKQVVWEVIMVDGLNEVDNSNKIDKYREIALS